MVNISSVGSSVIGSIGTGQAARSEVKEASESAPVRRGEDRVELSEASRLLAKLQGLPEIRQDLVDRVRAEIEAGTYETPEVIDATIEAMLSELEEEI